MSFVSTQGGKGSRGNRASNTPEQIQKSNSSPRSLGISQGNTQFDSKLSNNDLDCPIALRKGVRSCTNLMKDCLQVFVCLLPVLIRYKFPIRFMKQSKCCLGRN